MLTPNSSPIHCLTHNVNTHWQHCITVASYLTRQGGMLRIHPWWDAASLTPITAKHTHNNSLSECYLSPNKNRLNAGENWNNKCKRIASCEVCLLFWTWRVGGFVKKRFYAVWHPKPSSRWVLFGVLLILMEEKWVRVENTEICFCW